MATGEEAEAHRMEGECHFNLNKQAAAKHYDELNGWKQRASNLGI
jgi:hypothetical protein